ncbi:sugar phosphate isomerase/epimerase [Candidatus Bathyarchaeota archaeon]|nr:sugar phosphate isomerase/epimerase [Candidatus Bathyarchaeota archaeon]
MGKIEIGVSTLHLLNKPFNKMVKQITNIKTNNIEIVDDGFHALNKRRATTLKDIGESHNIKFSVHAPFADINIASPSRAILKAMLKRLENSIRLASFLEARAWVFHPGLKTGVSMFYPGEDWKQNRKTAQLLYKIAKDHGLEIAIENVPEPYPFLMKGVKDFDRFFNEVSEPIGLALDIGHSNINGQTEHFLRTFADKIVHIHAHDNDGKDDSHLGIGYGTVNWQKFASLLREISYDKAVIVESVEKVTESVSFLKSII